MIKKIFFAVVFLLAMFGLLLNFDGFKWYVFYKYHRIVLGSKLETSCFVIELPDDWYATRADLDSVSIHKTDYSSVNKFSLRISKLPDDSDSDFIVYKKGRIDDLGLDIYDICFDGEISNFIMDFKRKLFLSGNSFEDNKHNIKELYQGLKSNCGSMEPEKNTVVP